MLAAALSGCSSVPVAPERVFNVGDAVVVIAGDLSGSTGRVVDADASRAWYTVDFENHIQARRLYWNQLDNARRSARTTFAEGDRVVVYEGALAGKVGRVARVYPLLDDYMLQFDDGVQAGRFYATQLRLWTPPPAAAAQSANAAYEPPKVLIVPFSGAVLGADVGETFAWHLANLPDITKNYTVVPFTANIRRKTSDELLLDYEHVYYSPALDMSEQLNADYVFTGYTRSVGSQSLLLLVMLEAKTGRLVAGDWQSFLNTQQIPGFFPVMVKKILAAAEKNTKAERPKLAVRTISIPGGIEPAAAEALSSLLAIEIANNGMFSVYPRDALDAQRAEGADKTAATKADYVLSGKIASFNTKNQFLAEVVRVENNVLKTGASIDFGTVEDALSKIRKLAGTLTSE